MQIRWETDGSKPGAHQLYLGTADALWQLTPDAVLFFFEGEASLSIGPNCQPASQPASQDLLYVAYTERYHAGFAGMPGPPTPT